jgi:hypothetical protein
MQIVSGHQIRASNLGEARVVEGAAIKPPKCPRRGRPLVDNLSYEIVPATPVRANPNRRGESGRLSSYCDCGHAVGVLAE